MLNIRRITAGYGSIEILGDVTMRVESNEIVGIVGPNGSGKSTLLKTIMGLTTVYDGDVEWQGSSIVRATTHERVRMGLGYVPQTDNAFPTLTVAENLSTNGVRVAASERRVRLNQVHELFPVLWERRKVRAGSLSGGERRMLAIGACLMLEPRCLLLDEPTSDLAPAMVEVITEKIGAMHRALEIPIAIVEQNVEVALELVDRLYVLSQGRNRLDCRASEIDEAGLGELFMEGGGRETR